MQALAYIAIFGAFIYLVVALIGAFMPSAEETRSKQLTTGVQDYEAQRGNTGHFKWFDTQVAMVDMPKIGDFTIANTDGYFDAPIVCLRGGKIHFYVSGTPPFNSYNFHVIGIDYRPQYEHTTISETQGKGGSALVGGMVAGTAGAVIGASGKRQTTSVTQDKSISSVGILTLKSARGGNIVKVRVTMNDDVYTELATNYLNWNK